jgi:hypothetical protein
MRLHTAMRAKGAATAIALLCALGAAPQSASAQVFFRPFGTVFHERIVAEPPPYGTRRAIARILSEEGYRLIGPIGERGDEIVATGVDSRGRRMRFLIDPYVGDVVRAWRAGGDMRSVPDVARSAEPEREFVERDDGGPHVVHGVGPATPHGRPQSRLDDQRPSPPPRAAPPGKPRDLPPVRAGARNAPPIEQAPPATQANRQPPSAPGPAPSSAAPSSTGPSAAGPSAVAPQSALPANGAAGQSSAAAPPAQATPAPSAPPNPPAAAPSAAAPSTAPADPAPGAAHKEQHGAGHRAIAPPPSASAAPSAPPAAAEPQKTGG